MRTACQRHLDAGTSLTCYAEDTRTSLLICRITVADSNDWGIRINSIYCDRGTLRHYKSIAFQVLNRAKNTDYQRLLTVISSLNPEYRLSALCIQLHSLCYQAAASDINVSSNNRLNRLREINRVLNNTVSIRRYAISKVRSDDLRAVSRSRIQSVDIELCLCRVGRLNIASNILRTTHINAHRIFINTGIRNRVFSYKCPRIIPLTNYTSTHLYRRKAARNIRRQGKGRDHRCVHVLIKGHCDCH